MLLYPLPVGAAPLRWRVGSRRLSRRACIGLLRHHRVEITLPQTMPAEPRHKVTSSSLRIAWDQALQEVRARQKSEEFWEKYRSRSGIEGTISQGVRAFGLRRSRYRGMQKTHLQHLGSAAAINLARTLNWLDETSLAKTRTSKFAALALVA